MLDGGGGGGAVILGGGAGGWVSVGGGLLRVEETYDVVPDLTAAVQAKSVQQTICPVLPSRTHMLPISQ
jgi:hypothetical protein